jgi:hypothetical protein
MQEIISHIFGSCGDSHINIWGFFLEFPNLNIIFNKLKTWRKTYEVYQMHQRNKKLQVK